MYLHLFWSIYFISLRKVKFYDLLTHFHFYDVIWHHNVNCALATTTTMLIKLLFQKFIVYIMNNLCAKFGCHISSNSKDKQGGRNPPPQALSVSNHPGQIGLRRAPLLKCHDKGSQGLISFSLILQFQRLALKNATFIFHHIIGDCPSSTTSGLLCTYLTRAISWAICICAICLVMASSIITIKAFIYVVTSSAIP